MNDHKLPENIVVLDVESTTINKGNPFTRANKLCAVGLRMAGFDMIFNIEHGSEPYGEKLEQIKSLIEGADLLVGFNLKFDLHWIRRYIPSIRFPKVFDVQLGFFLHMEQRVSYPSLDMVSRYFGGDGKGTHDLFAEYGDTLNIPWDLLSKYLLNDLEITEHAYYQLWNNIGETKKELARNSMDDLSILSEMEYNGLYFDSAQAAANDNACKVKIQLLKDELLELYPYPLLNWGSGIHLSAVLFGGYIGFPCKISKARTLKDGTVKVREVNGFKTVKFPGIVRPWRNLPELSRSKGKTDTDIFLINEKRRKEGSIPLARTYATTAEVIQTIQRKRCGKKGKRLCAILLELAEQEKLASTYYGGLLKLHKQMDWEPNVLHGNFNPCVARTGRLSSSKPNLQNFAGAIDPLIISRYP